ncbi:MAG: hypothetical protein EXS35_06585 [Pedosphaera sp.]|nr:hypothetical protein [Pedosphaera sp.]
MKTIYFRILGAAILVWPACLLATEATNRPLPTLEEIFQKVVERAKQEGENDRAFSEKFSFVRSRTTEVRNSKSELKKQETKIATNNPVLKPPAVRPAPPSATATTNAEPVTDPRSHVRGKQFAKDDFRVNNDLIKRFKFTLVGRELLNGRPTLVIDFQPAAGKLPERNVKEKFINKTAGRVWLDEADYALVKTAIHLTEHVNVFGGLVGAVWKFTYGSERERVGDGLWFTRDEKWHLEGRETFRQRTVDFHGERTAVRKVQ